MVSIGVSLGAKGLGVMVSIGVSLGAKGLGVGVSSILGASFPLLFEFKPVGMVSGLSPSPTTAVICNTPSES